MILIPKILSRLPSNSVASFRCVLKQWASTLGSPQFKTLAKPRLLFAIIENGNENAKSCGVWSFFSSPQLEIPYDKSSSTTLVAAADFHVRFSPDNLLINHDYDLKYCSCAYVSGLFYIHGNRYQARPLICNPITGRYAILPLRYTYRKAYRFFGFDPIGKQYKPLSMAYYCGPGHNKILTLQDGDLTWTKIKCPLDMILRVMGSEKFTFIDVERFCRLEENFDVDATNELHVWVLEDVGKQEWSKYEYTWTDDRFFRRHVSIAGVTTSGEIVFSMSNSYTSKQPFYVFYFNPEAKTLQRVEIQGFGEAFKTPCSVRTFVNHVDDLNLNYLELLKSVHPPFVNSEYVGPSDSESD